jgi:hypothetical protein
VTRGSKKHLTEILYLLGNKLNKTEYAKVTSAMSMLFVGHTFEMSEDGFEFINLCVQAKKDAHLHQIQKNYNNPRQNNIVLLKPKK